MRETGVKAGGAKKVRTLTCGAATPPGAFKLTELIVRSEPPNKKQIFLLYTLQLQRKKSRVRAWLKSQSRGHIEFTHAMHQLQHKANY